MPVTGSSLAFSWAMVQDGVMRRSAEADSERICRGMSWAVWRVIVFGCFGVFDVGMRGGVGGQLKCVVVVDGGGGGVIFLVGLVREVR